MTLYKVSNLFILFSYLLSFPFIILAFTTKVSINSNIPCIYNLNFLLYSFPLTIYRYLFFKYLSLFVGALLSLLDYNSFHNP